MADAISEQTREEVLAENAALKEQLLAINVTLARLDDAIGSARGVALTAELSKAYMALDEIHPIGWLMNQLSHAHSDGMTEAAEIAKSNGVSEDILSLIASRSYEIESNPYWTGKLR